MSKKLTRRQLLRGAGGLTVALPFMPSLAPPAEAATVRRRFVSFGTKHGGVKAPNMYPADSVITNRQVLFGGHEIRWGRLQRSGEGALSRVVRGAKLSDRLAAKMNIIRGLDIPITLDHNAGGYLGNYAAHTVKDSAGEYAKSRPQPTIDQALAWSNTFYGNLSGIRQRSVVIGRKDGETMSFGHSSPSSKSGNIVPVYGESDLGLLFGKLITGTSAPPPGAPAAPSRAPVVDKVLASYKSLRESNRRLSAVDRQRLDDHMDRLAELQRTVAAVSGGGGAPASPACGKAAPASLPSYDGKEFYAAMNDLLVAAFLCDSTRLASCIIGNYFVSAGDWHKDVAHKAKYGGGAQDKMVESQQKSFEYVVLDLLAKMDVEEAPGVNLLDNSLVVWGQESGVETHYSESRPLVMAGSAGGFFKTGLYVDYRHPSRAYRREKAGIFHGQFLWNVLLAMGLPPAEFKRPNNFGYGVDAINARDNYESGVFSMAESKLPVVT